MSRFELSDKLRIPVASALVVGGALATALGVASASGAPHVHAKNVIITALKSARFGTILSDGTTLYTLKPNSSTCSSTCHKYWIEVLLPKGDTRAIAGPGVSAAKLGTVKVKGGHQVTYDGKPLFWFFEDRSAGQVKGNLTDTWGKWADVVLAKPTSNPPATTTTVKVTTTTTPAAPSPTTTVPTPTTTRPTTTTTAPGGGGGVGF